MVSGTSLELLAFFPTCQVLNQNRCELHSPDYRTDFSLASAIAYQKLGVSIDAWQGHTLLRRSEVEDPGDVQSQRRNFLDYFFFGLRSIYGCYKTSLALSFSITLQLVQREGSQGKMLHSKRAVLLSSIMLIAMPGMVDFTTIVRQ